MIHSHYETPKKLSLFTVGVLIAAVLSILLRIGSLVWFYDTEIGYYRSGALLPILSNWFSALCVIGCVILSCFGFKKNELSVPKAAAVSRLSALLPALCILVAAIGPYLTGRTEHYVTALPFAPSTLFLICSVCAVVAAVFFALLAFGVWDRSGVAPFAVLLGLVTLVYFTVSLGVAYFDFEVQMNSPNKLILQFALLSALLTVLSEMRILTRAPKPRLWFFSFAAATVLLGCSSIPSILAYVLGIFPSSYRNLFTDLSCLGLWLYCLIRLLCMAFPRKAEEPSAEETQETGAEATDTPAFQNPD